MIAERIFKASPYPGDYPVAVLLPPDPDAARQQSAGNQSLDCTKIWSLAAEPASENSYRDHPKEAKDLHRHASHNRSYESIRKRITRMEQNKSRSKQTRKHR